MKFFHYNGNEAQTLSSHRRFHKQIQQKTDLWSIYTCFGTTWQWSITPMFIFQFLELMTEKNIWQYGVQGRHLSPSLSSVRSISRPPWPARFAANLLPVLHKWALVQKYIDQCFFLPRILTYWYFSFPPPKQTTASPTLTRALRIKTWIMEYSASAVMWIDRTSSGFFKCQIINHLYKGSHHQL